MKRIDTSMITLLAKINKAKDTNGIDRELIGFVGGSESFSKDCNTWVDSVFDSDNIRFSEINTLDFYDKNKSKLLAAAVTYSDRVDCDSIVQMLKKEDKHDWLTDFDLDTLAQALYDARNSQHSYIVNYFVRLSAEQAYTAYHQSIKKLRSLFNDDLKDFLEGAASVHVDMIIYTVAVFGGAKEFIQNAANGLPSHESIDATNIHFSNQNLAGVFAANKERILDYVHNHAIWSGLFGQDHMIATLLKEHDTTGYLGEFSLEDIDTALADNKNSDHQKVTGYLMRYAMQKVCEYYSHQTNQAENSNY